MVPGSMYSEPSHWRPDLSSRLFVRRLEAMSEGLNLPRFSIGVGDRFAHQAKAQLAACLLAAEAGVEVVPVWNKSNREHTIIGSEPSQTRIAADEAVRALGWT